MSQSRIDFSQGEMQWLISVLRRTDVADDNCRIQIIKRLQKARGLEQDASRIRSNGKQGVRVRKTTADSGPGAEAKDQD